MKTKMTLQILQKIPGFVLFAAFFFFAAGCIFYSCGPMGEDMPRQEVLTSLRMLGTQSENAAYEIPALPSTDVMATVSIYAASPKDLEVKLESWQPDGKLGGVLLASQDSVSVVTPVMTKEKKGALNIYTGTVKVKIPPAALWTKFPDGGGKLAFGVKLSSSAETEYGLGNILAYPAGAAQFAWKAPNLELTAPTVFTATKNKELDLVLKSDPSQNEDLLFGWFVSSGQIAGRRSKETSWTPDISGTQTIIATVRGRDSLTFAWKVFTVEVQ